MIERFLPFFQIVYTDNLVADGEKGQRLQRRGRSADGRQQTQKSRPPMTKGVGNWYGVRLECLQRWLSPKDTDWDSVSKMTYFN